MNTLKAIIDTKLNAYKYCMTLHIHISTSSLTQKLSSFTLRVKLGWCHTCVTCRNVGRIAVETLLIQERAGDALVYLRYQHFTIIEHLEVFFVSIHEFILNYTKERIPENQMKI